MFETYFRTWYDRTQRPHCAGYSSHGQNKGFPLSKTTHFPNIAKNYYIKMRSHPPVLTKALRNMVIYSAQSRCQTLCGNDAAGENHSRFNGDGNARTA